MNELNTIKNYFKDLTFIEESHSYFVKDKKIKDSVSNLIKNFVEPFDVINISKSVAIKENTTPEVIQKRWEDIAKEACNKGSKIHLFGEKIFIDPFVKPSCNQEKALKSFWDSLPNYLEKCFSELSMYHKDYMYAGTSDVILRNNKTSTYCIVDYKTNKDLFKNFKNKKMLFPFNNLLDNAYNKYQIQFSFYQILLEQIKGIKVSSRVLVWLKNDGTYEIFFTEDYTEILKKYLKEVYCENI